MPIADDARREIYEALLEAYLSGAAGAAGTGHLVADSGLIKSRGMALAEKSAGDLITWAISENQDRLRKSVPALLGSGLSYTDQVAALEEQGFPTAKATILARSELGRASNLGEADQWESEGIRWVKILDGTGPASCETCRQADGQVWSIERYKANPNAHPHCERSAVPLPGYEPDGSEITDLEEERLAE